MPFSIFCNIGLHRKLKKSFANVKKDIDSLSNHVRYAISKITEQENLNKQFAKDIADLQKALDIASVKRVLKEEIRRELLQEIRNMKGREESKQGAKKKSV